MFRRPLAYFAYCPTAGLQPFDDLGHRKVLYAPPVVRTAMTYLTR